uniref:Uncharacterized protein n=1 Tax=Rhizophora mucronata TaxID=61149 RepID=A0A2P2KPI3_RHIMU
MLGNLLDLYAHFGVRCLEFGGSLPCVFLGYFLFSLFFLVFFFPVVELSSVFIILFWVSVFWYLICWFHSWIFFYLFIYFLVCLAAQRNTHLAKSFPFMLGWQIYKTL